jgi:predicted metal-dependent phosphoesterase TrpH
MVRVDIHLHSTASFDGHVEPERVAHRCRRLGLAPVFLTDHDTIDGAIRLWRQDPKGVVIGQEVTTADGELIGLFLEQAIPAHLSSDETVRRIRGQGGLVYLEHPYDAFRRRLSERAIERLADRIDVVEVFNGRSSADANRRAEDLCAILGAAPGAGSDAHTLGEIGSVYVEMDEFNGAREFLTGLRRGRIVRNRRRWRLMAEARLAAVVGRR